MISQRISRVNELMRRELGLAILREAPGGDTAKLTITKVDTAPNLRSAKVYISVRGSDEERELVMRHMRHIRADLQKHIGANLNLKYTPKLRLVEDRSLRTGGDVLDVLNELNPPDGSDEADPRDAASEEGDV